MSRVRVKVCCISSPHEARLAIDYGADAIGLVSQMPSGPGIIADSMVRTIAQETPPGVDTFLLTAYTTAVEIAGQLQACGTSTVQIVNHIDPSQYPELIKRMPMVRRVQVIHVENEQALSLIDSYSPYVHAFLLDSGRPNAAIAELGGTGRAHDWSISAEFVKRSPKPVFLAGGLNPANIADAIRQVNPYGVDLCSGVRENDSLNAPLLQAFIQSVSQASA